MKSAGTVGHVLGRWELGDLTHVYARPHSQPTAPSPPEFCCPLRPLELELRRTRGACSEGDRQGRGRELSPTPNQVQMGAGGRLIPGGSPICRGLGVRLWGSRLAHLPFALGSTDVASPGHIPFLPCTHGASSSKLLHLSYLFLI